MTTLAEHNLKRVLCLMLLFFILAGAVFSQAPLPKKAKLKTIKYSDYNYAAIGYVLDNKFIEGQEITFFNTQKTTAARIPIGYGIGIPVNKTETSDTIISGILVIKEGISYLESTINSRRILTINRSSTRGLYRVTNNKYSNNLTAIPADAGKLNIETADVYYYQGYYNNALNPVVLQKQQDNYLLKIEFDDRILETSVSYDIVKKYGFLAFDDFIKNSQNIKLSYNNGNSFVGIVEKNDNNYRPKGLSVGVDYFMQFC